MGARGWCVGRPGAVGPRAGDPGAPARGASVVTG